MGELIPWFPLARLSRERERVARSGAGAQPFNQGRGPPMACMWRWNTSCPPSEPVLTTVRKPFVTPSSFISWGTSTAILPIRAACSGVRSTMLAMCAWESAGSAPAPRGECRGSRAGPRPHRPSWTGSGPGRSCRRCSWGRGSWRGFRKSDRMMTPGDGAMVSPGAEKTGVENRFSRRSHRHRTAVVHRQPAAHDAVKEPDRDRDPGDPARQHETGNHSGKVTM
ncbi:hypothetical protein Ddc_23554 [Ditylenchus destructor]|nr:hypothetical protein Ddc_23554 [Ditylenchus destructor]